MWFCKHDHGSRATAERTCISDWLQQSISMLVLLLLLLLLLQACISCHTLLHMALLAPMAKCLCCQPWLYCDRLRSTWHNA